MNGSEKRPDGDSPSGLAVERAFRLWLRLLDTPFSSENLRTLELELDRAVHELQPEEFVDYSARVVEHVSKLRHR